MESELFGHVHGAFTGAETGRRGLLELGDGATVFFDEIGDIPAGVQVKLLRVLEQHEVTPVGDTTPRNTWFRVIAATNRDLGNRGQQGAFREDLFFRLAGSDRAAAAPRANRRHSAVGRAFSPPGPCGRRHGHRLHSRSARRAEHATVAGKRSRAVSCRGACRRLLARGGPIAPATLAPGPRTGRPGFARSIGRVAEPCGPGRTNIFQPLHFPTIFTSVFSPRSSRRCSTPPCRRPRRIAPPPPTCWAFIERRCGSGWGRDRGQGKCD